MTILYPRWKHDVVACTSISSFPLRQLAAQSKHRPLTSPPLVDILMDKVIDLRSRCRHFRILVIGRANAGKTTLLKKVCNSIEDPEILSPKFGVKV